LEKTEFEIKRRRNITRTELEGFILFSTPGQKNIQLLYAIILYKSMKT
jgi:hypothetical protein